jgi:hypothetical protein
VLVLRDGDRNAGAHAQRDPSEPQAFLAIGRLPSRQMVPISPSCPNRRLALRGGSITARAVSWSMRVNRGGGEARVAGETSPTIHQPRTPRANLRLIDTLGTEVEVAQREIAPVRHLRRVGSQRRARADRTA